jgi:FAD/FMN-containing dehydrogenase/Fe-S oxidoreductase
VQLDLSKYFRSVLEINSAERTARVQPGVVLDRLNAAAAEHGLTFGPDVATASRATLGGMIANDACGARSIRYGKTLDHVDELTVVLADGSVATFGPLDPDTLDARCRGETLDAAAHRTVRDIGRRLREDILARYPKVMRNVAGYHLDRFVDAEPFNLASIVVGSEGTLCIVVEAGIRLVPLPASKAVLVAHFDSVVEAMRAIPVLVPLDPVAVELLDDRILRSTAASPTLAPLREKFLVGDPGAVLVIEAFGEADEDMAERLGRFEAVLREQKLGHAFARCLSHEEQDAVWTVRKAGQGSLMRATGDYKSQPFVEDTCVPIDRLAEHVERFESMLARLDVEAGIYGHASVGLVHIRPILNLKTQTGVDKLRTIAHEACAMTLAAKGSYSGEHGDGMARSGFLEDAYGPRIVEAFAEIKHAFDPDGIMNPGKIVDPYPMTENLRYGPGYTSNPPPETVFDYTYWGSMTGLVEMCNGLAQCRKTRVETMCPSYIATLDELHTTRARANALRMAMSGELAGESWTGESVKQAMDLCLGCKACKTECPTGVDMARLKSEVLHARHAEHGVPLRTRFYGAIDRASVWGSRLAPISNWLARNPLTRLLNEKLLGLSRWHNPPAFSRQTFPRWFQGRRPNALPSGSPLNAISHAAKQVVLFHDTWMDYYLPSIGIAAVRLLEAAGYEVILTEGQVCCGRPMFSAGLLDRARELARHNIEVLAPYARAGIPIVGCEPSCVFTLIDEYTAFKTDDATREAARLVADNTYLLESFLRRELEAERITLPFTETAKTLHYHGHCYQKAMIGTADAMAMLGRPPGYNVHEIPAGCCGMAGAFGYEAEHYEVSRLVGEERLFPAVRDALRNDGDDERIEVVISGFSCRHQIAHHTRAAPRHLVEVLADALA